MVKCPKCGAEIKYIPMGFTRENRGVAVVDAEYTEVFNDNGRLIKGHIRHRCLETPKENTVIGTGK